MPITTPKNKTRLAILVCIILILITLPLTIVSAQNSDPYGLEKTAKTAELKGTRSDDDLPFLIGNIIYAFLGFLGVVFFILVLYGGFTWMTAQGNKEQISKARGIITSAAIGLIIVLASYAVTSFIMDEVISGTGIGGEGINTVCDCVTGPCIDLVGTDINCGPDPIDGSFESCTDIGLICCCGNP